MIFGDVTYEKDHWHITCEPHVRTKLKRLFPEIDQRSGASSVLSDNEENCRDPLWFLDRYPMVIDRLDHLKSRASLHVEQENQIDALLSFRLPSDDFELHYPARDYQKIASLAMIKRGLLVDDPLGLGKTVTAICLLTRADHLPALVITIQMLKTECRTVVFVRFRKDHRQQSIQGDIGVRFPMAAFPRKAVSHFNEPVGTTNQMPTAISLCPMFQYLMPLYKPHKTYLLLTQGVTISGRKYPSQVELN